MRTSIKRILTAGAAVAVGIGLLAGPASNADAATTSAAASSSSVAVLMQSYDANSGRIGGGWWTGAVALSTVMTYRQATGDSKYDYAISDAYAKNPSFTNEYIDDTGWWALVWLQAYDITGNRNYLTTAQTTVNYMHNYWDSTCGGGVYWSTAKQYKASIANELFLAATAELHNRIAGDTTYLGWANAEWNWFKGSGLINSNLIQDGLNAGDCSHSTANYSYNQGVVLQGLTDLSKATGDTSLLTTARTIATAATQRFTQNGVLYDGCEPNCTGDGQSFKGIFIRYLRALATATHTTDYDPFINDTAAAILAYDTNGSGQQGDSFVGPFAQWTYNTQAAAAEALVASIGGTGSGPLHGSESGRCVDVPNNTTANSTKLALWDCNAGNNQQWTLTADKQLRVYGNKCLDVNGAGTADGTAVLIYDCHSGTNQQWTLNADGSVVGAGSGKCLDATGHGTVDGTLLEIWTCNGGTNQKWSRS